MTTEAVFGVIQPQAKEHPGPQRARRGKKQILPPEPLEGSKPDVKADTSETDFTRLASQTVRE